MILLDPDLDPDPPPTSRTGTPSSASPLPGRDLRLPSVRSLSAFLREAQTIVRLNGAVSVLLTTDKAIRTLNRSFRGMNKATDVLSFPVSGLSRSAVAGDLAISVDTARVQAREQGHSLPTEIKVLMLHGLLHLAGYDHETDSGRMARRERTLRARLKLPLGLIERATRKAPIIRRTAGAALKGHGSSRAEKARKKTGALAPEERASSRASRSSAASRGRTR